MKGCRASTRRPAARPEPPARGPSCGLLARQHASRGCDGHRGADRQGAGRWTGGVSSAYPCPGQTRASPECAGTSGRCAPCPGQTQASLPGQPSGPAPAVLTLPSVQTGRNDPPRPTVCMYDSTPARRARPAVRFHSCAAARMRSLPTLCCVHGGGFRCRAATLAFPSSGVTPWVP